MNPFNANRNLTTLTMDCDNNDNNSSILSSNPPAIIYNTNINKFMETELTLLKNLDITPDPYLQTQSLIQEGLLLLYGEYYTEYIKKQSEDHKPNSGDGYYKYLDPNNLTEWANLTTQLYSLTQQIHECMKKCMSEFGGGFTYYGQEYKQIQSSWEPTREQRDMKNIIDRGGKFTAEQEKFMVKQKKQEIENQKHYESTNVIWSDAGAHMRINLARLGETHGVYLSDVGKNLMLLKKLWQKNHSLSLRSCAWPVVAQTQGITRWLMYVAYKQVQAYELKIQLQKKYNSFNNELMVDNKQYWANIFYALKWIKLLEQEDCVNVLRQPLWSVSDPQSYEVSDQWFAHSLYGLYQQCGDWHSLTQYIWLSNPLLSQQFENYAEYFAPHSSYADDSLLVREWGEWLLFANIANTPANKPWLEWRQGVEKLVELMVKNFDGDQISTIVQVFVHEYNLRDWAQAQKESENNLQKYQLIFKQVKCLNPLLEQEIFSRPWHDLTNNKFIFKQQDELRKSFVQLRAKLLGAPYQYGEVGNHLEILRGPNAEWYWDESEWSRFK